MYKRIALCYIMSMLCLLLLSNAITETREGVIWLEGMKETIE